MEINATTLEAFNQELSLIFNGALGKAPNVLLSLATLVSSKTKLNTYGFMNALKGMRKWVGPKRVNSLATTAYTIVNDPYEDTIGVKRDDLEDDQIGLLPATIQDFAQQADNWPDQLLAALIKVGTTTLCYDGQYFFDTDHPVGDSSVANMSGSGGVQPYYYLQTNRPLKPFIFQTRKKPTFVPMVAPTSENVFHLAEFLYSIEARGAAGFGFWQMAYRCTDAIAAGTFTTCRTAMNGLKDDEGEALGVEPDTILVGVSNRTAAETLFETRTLSTGGDNPNYNKVKVVYSARLP